MSHFQRPRAGVYNFAANSISCKPRRGAETCRSTATDENVDSFVDVRVRINTYRHLGGAICDELV